MQIAYKKFVQLTALLAAGSIVPACNTSDPDDQSSSGGTSNPGGAGGPATGGASAQGGVGENAAGTSSSAPSAAGASSAAAGATAHNDGTAGSSTTVNSSSVAGSGGHNGGAAGSGAAGGVAGGSSAGASSTGGTTQCVPAGDPAAEGTVSIDCSQLPFANISCDPSGEGLATYGSRLCDTFAREPKAAAQALFDCLERLVAPSEGWCGDTHATQAESCLATVAARTCMTSSAETACEAIHSRCSEVSVSECRGNLSMRSEVAAATVDPCMESTGFLSCSARFEYCSDMPERMLDTTETCANAIASCPALTSTACAQSFWGEDLVYERFYRSVKLCWDAAVAAGSPCDEAFTDCASVHYGS